MLIALLLLIAAILLFGSSAIIGAFGMVLGFISFAAALGFAAYHSGPLIESMGYTASDAPALIIIALLMLLLAGKLISHLITRGK